MTDDTPLGRDKAISWLLENLLSFKKVDAYVFLNANRVVQNDFLYKINEAFDFLGFKVDGNKIDIAHSTLIKIKQKIRLESRSIRRWSYVKKVNPHSTLKVLNKKFNRKFFGKENGELSWMYWYFPVINTTESLKIIEQRVQKQIH